MALFILTAALILNSFKCLLTSQNAGPVRNELKITPSMYSFGRYFGVYQVEDMLNLSCILSNETETENIIMDWTIPLELSSRVGLIISHVSSNFLNLLIKNVTENDSGEYKCTALDPNKMWYSEKSIIINVKNKKGECSDVMFQCSCGMCIHKRYTCDGFKDCHHGEDELSNYCGSVNPCYNKLRCPDGRCIPFEWCCDVTREINCTIKQKHECCIQLEKPTYDIDGGIGFQYKEHEFYGWDFLQTTIYTAIGCALAFMGMFIVIIIIMVTCRTHMRRSLMSRCPVTTNARSLNLAPSTTENYVPFYDVDIYFNRPGANDLTSVNPLLVTYNINNGVQFVGGPVEPPPYCEISTSPIEGPPPPYASRENLNLQLRESTESKNVEGSESETLLSSSSQIRVISSNAIDGCSRINNEARE